MLTLPQVKVPCGRVQGRALDRFALDPYRNFLTLARWYPSRAWPGALKPVRQILQLLMHTTSQEELARLSYVAMRARFLSRVTADNAFRFDEHVIGKAATPIRALMRSTSIIIHTYAPP